MPEEIWQNLAEWLEKSLDDKGEFYNDIEAATVSYLNNSLQELINDFARLQAL